VKAWGFFVCIEFNVDLLERSEKTRTTDVVPVFRRHKKHNSKGGAKVGHRQTASMVSTKAKWTPCTSNRKFWLPIFCARI